MTATPAYLSVRANFTTTDYDNVCEDFGGGFERLPAWRDLGNLLAHRSGWHFDVANGGEAIWCLGVLGESRLVIHVNENLQYHCYDHGEDSDILAADIPAVEGWLDGREDEARTPSTLLIELASSEGWQLLRRYPFQVRVSWSDGYFSATLPSLAEASFGATLSEAVSRACEMICHFLGAPVALASELTITTELDRSASQQIRTA
ncbi:hypothetical protein [Streptomyces sp. SLBN-115]|uniref:hypothetical protein n=1 Tax=Streptomyces sp. SLBN-115 TaxID=2768453 RepID=UPI00114E3892|nr:hypothetical protein [Streptomyces sp. SLBN-115]TQJ55970.1 hypothetical protein FBY34_3784 [Streptomyces sp. SLBN-115]